jgi:FtsH-binding integral membrane protein
MRPSDYLHDHDDTRNSATLRPQGWTGMSEATFMSKVLPFFAGGLLVTALGTRFGAGLGPGFLIMAVILNFVFYFALLWNRHTPVLNVVLYYSYTFLNGLLLGPLVMTAKLVGGATLVSQALVGTAIAFFLAAGYVYVFRKDMSGLAPFLISGLIVVIIAGIVNMFYGGSGLGLGISVVSLFLFMGFTAYDMSNIMFKYRDEEYMLATVQLYLDFVNIFVAILRILIYFSGGRSRD